MSHLTPEIKSSMEKIFEAADISYLFMDKNGGICCGRPTLLTGQKDAAQKLMQKNKGIIEQSGAKILVTSCPICYKMFNEEYQLNIPVLHHTQYINQLITKKQLNIQSTDTKVVFHDPCDLGRNSGVYNEPREILSKIAQLQPTPFDKEKGLCCGGSLGNTEMTYNQRKLVSFDAVKKLTEQKPDILVTACPLCKKTFADTNHVQVKDISQLVIEAVMCKQKQNEVIVDSN